MNQYITNNVNFVKREMGLLQPFLLTLLVCMVGIDATASEMMLSPRRVDTDLSGYDNVIYITPFIAEIGSQTEISIRMKNTAEIRGFQFDLYLPEGMTAVKNSKGRIQASLSAARLPDEDEHTLSFSEQADGAIRFLCSSQYDETFTGTDGEIATLRVNVDESVSEGDYPILLKAMKLTESDIRNFYTTDVIETTVTVCYDLTTRINKAGNGVASKDTEVYDLAGRKVAKSVQKGVYIVGGHKLLKR